MQFISYCFCGCICVVVDFLFFSTLINFKFQYQYANFISYFIATLFSFILNRLFTFEIKNYIIKRLLLFISISIAGYFISTIMLFILKTNMNINIIFLKVLTFPIVVLLQYSLNKKYTFKE